MSNPRSNPAAPKRRKPQKGMVIFMRKSGILMPISSLDSPYGVGTLGKAAFQFADFLKEAGQTIWQILPVSPTSYGDSPYQSFSTFAGNPYFIDLELLCEEGLLTQAELDALDWGFSQGKRALDRRLCPVYGPKDLS